LVTFDADNTQFPQAQIAETDENSQEWRRIYMMQHEEMGSRASEVIKFVIEWPATLSLEALEYQHAVETMSSLSLGFQDVELFLFKPNLSVLLNLIGLLYCIQHLKPQREQILDAMRRCGVSEQVVWVKWLTLGRWSHGRRMRDEIVSRQVCLLDVVKGKEETVLRVLQRGVVHEVLRVCVSTADLAYATCTSSTIRNY
jgi:hypothetical protein